jgi:hypothetical protein
VSAATATTAPAAQYRLPPFRRIVWASEAARDHWQPRIERFPALLGALQCRAVAAGAHDLAVVEPPGPAPDTVAGKFSAPLDICPLTLAPDDAMRLFGRARTRVAVGVGAVACRDLTLAQVIELIDCPPCCAAAITAIDVTPTDDPARRMVVAEQAGDRAPLAVAQPLPGANILWASFHVRPVPFVPCRFDCAAAHAWFGRHAAYLRPDEAPVFDDLAELLGMASEWSVLHGIAELRTPIAKVIHDVDASDVPYVVQLAGNRKPRHFATGLRFPFARPGA